LAGIVNEVMDDADVRVIERGGGLGLAFEARKGVGIGGDFGKKFKGYEAVEAGVFGFVHDAHAATA
jgi:hypothetical protein